MEEYSVSDYSIFNDAISTTKSFTDKIETVQSAVNDSKSKLNDEAVFLGPICDSCIKGFTNLDGSINSLVSNFGTISGYLNDTANAYVNGDSEAMKSVLSLSNGKVCVSSNNTTGSASLDGNVLNVSSPVTTGDKYNLSEDDLAHLAYVAYREQGSVDGAKLELSLMANLYEKNKNKYSSVRDYVDNSGWFASGSRTGYSYPGDDYYSAAKEVLNDGNRYLESNVVEHDCLSDIQSISTGDVSNRSDYIPGETVIKNRYGSTYVFVGFAPNGGDPFGYIV